MASLARDPIINAVNNGIRRGISIAIDGGAFGSAAILIYSGMDSMAFLGMPTDQEDVTKRDFIAWADRYIRFPCEEQLSGADLYGARCAMLHNYSVFSRMSRNGECRVVGYADRCVPEVHYNSAINENVVVVSVSGLSEAFSRGIDQFLIDAFAVADRRQVLESRLRQLVQCMPYESDQGE